MLSTTYDLDADALYISLRQGVVARTDSLDDWTMVDVDASGRVLGVEVLHPARMWPMERFLTSYRVGDSAEQLLTQMFPPADLGRHAAFSARNVSLNATVWPGLH